MKFLIAYSLVIMFASISCGFLTPPPVPTPQPTWPPIQTEDKVVRLDIKNRRSREHHSIEILKGTTVIWLSDDSSLHNIRHTRHLNDTETLFLSANYAAGEDFRVTFNDVGEYRYFCEAHAGHSIARIYVVEEFGTSEFEEYCTGSIRDHDDGKVCDWVGDYNLTDIENLYAKYEVITPHDHDHDN